MNPYILTALAAVSLLFHGTARADFNLKSYTELRQHDAVREKLDDYATGVGRGIFWTNARFGVHGAPKLFCLPPNLAPDQGLILSLLDQEIRAPITGEPYADDTPIEFIILRAFESRFPCNDTTD